MTIAKKTLGLPRPKDLKSNKLQDIQDHLSVLYDVLDRSYRNQFVDIGRLLNGTEQGQLFFWDNTKKQLVPMEISEMFWDDIRKRMGLNQTAPKSLLEVNGTAIVKRALSGGVYE